jgi:hypothetical protein
MGSSRKRALQSDCTCLGERGLARFDVLGREADRDLIRAPARQLAEEGPEASRLCAVVSRLIAGEPRRTGGILGALRRSPLVGADVDPGRAPEDGSDVAI